MIERSVLVTGFLARSHWFMAQSLSVNNPVLPYKETACQEKSQENYYRSWELTKQVTPLEPIEYEVIVTNLACYLSSIYIIPKRTRGIIVKYIHKLSVE